MAMMCISGPSRHVLSETAVVETLKKRFPTVGVSKVVDDIREQAGETCN